MIGISIKDAAICRFRGIVLARQLVCLYMQDREVHSRLSVVRERGQFETKCLLRSKALEDRGLYM